MKSLKVGDWAIEETVSEDPELPRIWTTHVECKDPCNRMAPGATYRSPGATDRSSGVAAWTTSDLHPRCWYCHEAVPDEIQALLILRLGEI